MKVKRIVYLLLAAMLLGSCMKDIPDSLNGYTVSKGEKGSGTEPAPESKVLKASVESLSFSSYAGNQSFGITSNTSWQISCDADWVTVTESTTRGTGNGTVTATVQQNSEIKERTASITISSTDAGSVKVSITQAGANPNLQLNKKDLSFTGAESSDSFSITSNTSWTVTSDQTWCSVSTSSGSNNATVTVNVSENKSTSLRNAMITVKAGEQSQTIAVTQAGANPTLQLNKTNMTFESASSSGNFTIASNTSWTITSDQAWCTLSSSSGSNNSTITVNVSENISIESRSATIIVKAGEQSQTIAVTQTGAKVKLQLSKTSMSFESSSGSNSFTITSNTSWSVTSNQSWCTLSSSSGSDNGTITVNVTENTTTSSRSATITVKAGDLSQTITVTQAGANATLQLNKSSMAFESSSGSGSFTISSNTSWSISSNQSWCTLSSSSGSNNATVTLYVSENTSTSSRSATISVESATIKRTLAVTQNGVTPTPTPASQDRTFTVGGLTFKMIAVEGGTFTMGRTSEQGSDAYDNERPTHSVTLSSYSIGETEVTQALWQAVMGSNPSYFSGSNKPVEKVSWDDCQDFIRRLNALTGENFRLPTEAEWEYAARGGNKSRGYKYAGSNTLGNVAWYWDNIPSQSSGSAGYGTQVVATKSPNELGLYDMSGNVWEWCQDWYDSYSSGSQTNPTGPSWGSIRVRRGGSWHYFAGGCRVSYRYFLTPDLRSDDLGLRLALQ